mgnify:CR=1 FL=1
MRLNKSILVLFILAIFVVLSTDAKKTTRKKHYNILSLDGGGVRGLITVQLLTKFEKYAYEYSTK